jgi:hypothetical protein
VPQDVELIINDAALRGPLFKTQAGWFPHIHATGLNASAPPSAQLRPEELLQRFLLSVSAKPQRLASLQIAHHREKLVALSSVDLIHTHLPQRCSRLCAFHLSRQRRSMARTVLSTSPDRRAACRADALSHACATASSKRLLNGALPGSRGTFSTFTPQSGHFTLVDLHGHRAAELARGQIPHGAFTAVIGTGELVAAARTFQLAIPALSPHPQIQSLLFLVDRMPVYPITGPMQDSCELVVRRRLPNLAERPIHQSSVNPPNLQILAQSRGCFLRPALRISGLQFPPGAGSSFAFLSEVHFINRTCKVFLLRL